MLCIENVSVFYGKAVALKGISLRVEEKEFVSLLGANGAGKSTLLKTISGILHPGTGRITLDGEEIHKLSPHQIVKKGVIHVPEGREIFPDLTVFENLQMGAYTRNDPQGVRKDLGFIFDVFPRLRERRSQIAGTLSGGEAQMLAIGRGLLSSPRYLMLDEPSLGIAPLVRDTIFETIQMIYRERGISILLVEQNAKSALKMSQRAYVLENGGLKLEGSGSKLIDDPYVKEAYLGY